jgi:hypothetical protein
LGAFAAKANANIRVVVALDEILIVALFYFPILNFLSVAKRRRPPRTPPCATGMLRVVMMLGCSAGFLEA